MPTAQYLENKSNQMNKITKVSENYIKLLIDFECGGDVSKYLKAYKCPAGVWTIGIGTTVYANGFKVKEGDVITARDATNEALNHAIIVQVKVSSLVKKLINQNQFDALCCFAQNVGLGAFEKSTLLRKVNENPSNPLMREYFLLFCKIHGAVSNGLLKRRGAEANLYMLKP